MAIVIAGYARPLWVVVHRYVGLVLTLFLLVVGITGSFLAFYQELDAAFNPHLYRAEPPQAAAPLLDPLVLRERAEQLMPNASLHDVTLKQEHGKAALFYVEGAVDPVTGEQAELAVDELFLDPYTGEELGRRKWGDITQGWTNFLPFLYRLHYSLAIPGEIGRYALGIAALLWTIDCFVGFYLTLPLRRRNAVARMDRESRRPATGFWQRWKPAWRVKWKSSSYRVNFDLHRASGLWLWAMLFVFAWSSVALNLREVYDPAMGAFFEFSDPYVELPNLPVQQPQPGLGWDEALRTGRELMAQQAAAGNFIVFEEHRLSYYSSKAMFRYVVRSNRDIRDRHPSTAVFFDANTGGLRYLSLPTGQASGNTVTHWLFALHFGAVFGLPYRTFVCIMGAVVVMLAATGLVVWWRKRQARHLKALGNVARQRATVGER